MPEARSAQHTKAHVNSKACVIPLITDGYAFTHIFVIKRIQTWKEGTSGGVVTRVSVIGHPMPSKVDRQVACDPRLGLRVPVSVLCLGIMKR